MTITFRFISYYTETSITNKYQFIDYQLMTRQITGIGYHIQYSMFNNNT